MKKVILLLFVLIFSFDFSAAGNNLVYVAKIDKEIDLAMAPYIRRAISEAEKENASAIIFKINTFGGRVDAATQIKDAIISTNLLTIAYIDHRAISAGSYIALSCDKIVMAPGSSIGAATVVNQSGQKMSEKYQSFMRSEMRSVAEKNHRRVDIAQGMVDERIVVPGLVDSTELITLTTDEALKYGIADTVVSGIGSLLKDFGLENATLVNVNPDFAEDLVGFLHNPIVTTLLLMIGFVGLFFEVKTPGWGIPGTVGILALLLFFGSSYILDLASSMEIIMFIGGLILLGLEIFVIPGFGITGVLGILLILASLFLALIGSVTFVDFSNISVAIIQLTVSLLAALGSVFLFAKYLPKSKRFNRLILAETEKSESGFVSRISDVELLGAEGVALTTLRPAGTAEINNKKVDVTADGEYIEQGSKIKVLRVEGMKVVVRKFK